MDIYHRILSADEFVEVAEIGQSDVTLELIEGRLRQRPAMQCGPPQAVAIARIGHALANWLDFQFDGDGIVAAGEARCRIATLPDTIIGIDLVYFATRTSLDLSENPQFFDGPPVLAIEVLSDSDDRESVAQRIRLLLAAGVAQVWIADPDFQTIKVHRSDAEPVIYASQQEIEGGDDLPGFRARVATLFTGARRND